MKQGPRILVTMLALVVLTGCLEYERQTMSCRHDTAADTLYIFQDYQGIFGADDTAALTDDEVGQLKSVMTVERTFFFNNWITEYNRRRLEETLQTPQGQLDPDAIYEAAIRALADLALANVKVANVGFYFGRDKHLSGAQRVTIKNVSKVLAALNKVLLFFARDQARENDKSEEEKTLLSKFSSSGQDVLRLEGHRLEIRWPITEEDYRKCMDGAPTCVAFKAAGGDIRRDGDLLVLTVGQKDAKSLVLTLPFSEKSYSTNAVKEATKFGIKESFDAVAAAKAFLEGSSSAAKP